MNHKEEAVKAVEKFSSIFDARLHFRMMIDDLENYKKSTHDGFVDIHAFISKLIYNYKKILSEIDKI